MDKKLASLSESVAITAFKNQMHNSGIDYIGSIVVGRIKRFDPARTRNKTGPGWYFLNKDPKGRYYGAFGVYGKVDKVKFSTRGGTYGK